MDQESLVFNGLDALTGHHVLRLGSLGDLARHIRRGQPPQPTKDVAAGMEARDLGEAGWAMVFPESLPLAVREALEPLLDRRRQQAGPYYREVLYHAGDDEAAFLKRLQLAPGQGPVDPVRLPYYLLLIGSPEDIPFELQFQLDIQYAVGRLHFEIAGTAHEPDLDAYARYVSRVIAAEDAAIVKRRKVAFFAPESPGDRVTQLLSQELVPSLVSYLDGRFSDWSVDPLTPEQSTRERLGELLSAPTAPALVWAATHGLVLSPGDEFQEAEQGALVCQGWKPQGWNEPISPKRLFTAADLELADTGSVVVLFACFSAGTPRHDHFAFDGPNRHVELAPRPFIARLPQTLLADAGALAVIGHVDRAWTWSFRSSDGFPLLSTFESVLHRLLTGYPVGAAMEYVGARYAQLAAQLLAAWKPGADDEAICSLWTACHDARNFIVLGDPAVRLATGAPTSEDG